MGEKIPHLDEHSANKALKYRTKKLVVYFALAALRIGRIGASQLGDSVELILVHPVVGVAEYTSLDMHNILDWSCNVDCGTNMNDSV